MIKIGIAGAGLRGRMYAEALADSPHAEVVALAEPSAKVADDAREETGIPVVPSLDDLLGQFEVDAVVVATPDFAHRDPVITAARLGKHLLIEKPLAMTIEDAYAMRDAIGEGGASCLVGFENRWNPHVVQAKRAIASGAIGIHITTTATLSNNWFVPTTMLSWAARSSPAWFLMPHTVDLALWFSGSEPVSVMAMASAGHLRDRGINTVDVVHAVIAFEDGSTAALSSVWTLPDGSDAIVDFRFQVIGTEGAISADPIHQGLDLVTDRRRTQGTLAGRIGGSLVGAPIWMVQEWAAGLDRGEMVGPGIDQGVLVTETICAIERSFSEHRSVTLAELRH